MSCGKVLIGAAFLVIASHVSAAPSDEEISELGKSLTPFGAIRAGNADQSIPDWDGGLCSPPPGYKPIKGVQGGPPYIDPFAEEKPKFVITAENWTEYKDKLDAGTQQLFVKYPDTFRVNVYPTHRTACFPQWVYDNTINRVKNPKLVGDAPGLVDAHAQIPFPIPKSGYEVMWNANLKYEPAYLDGTSPSYLVDRWGNSILMVVQRVQNENLYWDNSLERVPENKPFWSLISTTLEPAASSGVKQLRIDFLNTHEREPMAWSYIPGQRRVRLAPEFKYDTVSTTSGGISLFDEINGFTGKMDKFDFKLLGRKEMIVPYNAYKQWNADPKVVNTPNHSNPDMLRWELHRVWEVEATLKPSARHIQKVKKFLVDEDSWNILVYYSLDQNDRIHHLMWQTSVQQYEKPGYRNGHYVLYDFTKGIYGTSPYGSPGMTGFFSVEPWHKSLFTQGALGGSGLR